MASISLLSTSSSSTLSSPLKFQTQTKPKRKPQLPSATLNPSHRRLRRCRLLLAAPSAASPEVEKDPSPSPPPAREEAALSAVVDSVKVLKEAAKTRKVPVPEVLSALATIKKAKLDPSLFFETLGGSDSPGRTWMLIFSAQGRLEKGRYFPVTAVQRFDAAGKRIENGIYLGPIGCLTFEGRLSWKKKILAFIFERVRIKIGPFGPLEISLKGGGDREPSTKDPFFVWFYVDEEIAVAQGRGGGVAYWCRCHRVP